MKQQPTEPTVSLAEACKRLGIDYDHARLVLSVAKRTPQGWVVAVKALPPPPCPFIYDADRDQ